MFEWRVTHVFSNLTRLIGDEDAQDLVEYALLGAFVALAGAVVWQSVVTLLGQRYTEFNTNVPLEWEPPDPAGGS